MIESFDKEKRTKNCEDLMLPEVRELLDLSLDEKIEKSKEIMKEAMTKYKHIGLGFSGGTDSLVLLHLMLQVKPDIETVFVDTQHDLPETYNFIEQIRREWHLVNHTAVMANENKMQKIADRFGMKTPEFTEICCGYHKIAPMMKTIGDLKFDAFFVGLRGVEHEERAKETFFSQRKEPAHIRVHPIVFWRSKDILDYVKKFNLKVNPLYAQGFTSLGCYVCTDKNTDPNAHERAGRGVTRENIMKRLRDLGYT
ncbi:MAG: phosphoadenosine phosphosulfate reductase family protein [Nanoarchaeota archaeon]|nr:phosphoadenosine phosphosulfate reductase family protein [Nanoarchaeota archaeon]MBU4124414.1 phosphoadenosine phosphosulfate reductase family protein [Nanoarchaeota archaeon]